MSAQVISITTTPFTTKGPGIYLVEVINATVQLETWTSWSNNEDSITIKDTTGSLTPNITVNAPSVGATQGTIDDSVTPINILQQNESITFVPVIQTGVQNGYAWTAKSMYVYNYTLPSSAYPIAGSNTQIQFNNSTAFGGDASLTWNNVTKTLTVGQGSTINTITPTSIVFSNATNSTTVNSSIYTGTVYNANNALYLNNIPASSYIDTTDSYTITGVHTHNANAVFNASLVANGSPGFSGTMLMSNGSSIYWGAGSSSGPIASDTQIAYNHSGIETGDANLVWNYATSTLKVANTIFIGNSVSNATINSTFYSGIVNNSLTLGGQLPGYYTSNNYLQSTPTLSGGLNINGNLTLTGTFIGNMPAPTASTLGGVESSTAPTGQFATGLNTSGNLLYAYPAFIDISGTAIASQVPALSALTGSVTASQVPALSALTGSVTATQLPIATTSTIGAIQPDITTAVSSTGLMSGVPGYRNRFINGDMRIDQRNNGANSTVTNTYTVDRWAYDATQASKLTWGRNLNAIAGPPGFPYYLGFQSSSAYSVVSSDYFFFFQPIEADFVSDFAWGTSNGKTVTLSFWAYSSLGGATPFSGCISNYAETRNYPFTFSIPTANTWTYITVIIPPDVAGTWVMSGNGGALYLFIDLGSGTAKRGTAGAWSNTLAYGVTNAVSIVGTSGATFYITGIQMEVGSIATPFERLPPYQSLANCQRYYSTGVCQVGGYITSSGWILHTVFTPVSMRANPTIGFIYTGLNNVTGTYSNVVLSNQSFYTLGFGTAVGIASYIANWTALAEL